MKVCGGAGIDLTTLESGIGLATVCDCRSRGGDIDILETFAHFSVKNLIEVGFMLMGEKLHIKM